MAAPYRIPNHCTTQLTVGCRAEDREKIKAAIPLVPDDELPDRLVYGLEQSDCFDGTWENLDLQLWLTTQQFSGAVEALADLQKSFEISYRLEAYCDFYWREKPQEQYWDEEVLWFMERIGAELAIEVKWREMWCCGLPQRHMVPEPCFVEIGSMEELELLEPTLQSMVEQMAYGEGLFALCANPGFGATTLQMQLMGAIKRQVQGRVCVVTLELTKAQYLQRMKAVGVDTANVVIADEIHTVAGVNAFLQKVEDLSLVVIDRPSLLGEEAYAGGLKRLSRRLRVPILVTGGLSRASGEDDPRGRPEVWDVVPGILRDYSDVILLLHRDHSMERGIGHTERYDISNAAEIIVGKNDLECFFDSAFIRWNPERNAFDLSENL